jgi:hypothetical protein
MGDAPEKIPNAWVQPAKFACSAIGIIGAFILADRLTYQQDPIRIPQGVTQLEDTGTGSGANKNFYATSASQAEQIDCGQAGSLGAYPDNNKISITLKGATVVACEGVGSDHPVQSRSSMETAIDN